MVNNIGFSRLCFYLSMDAFNCYKRFCIKAKKQTQNLQNKTMKPTEIEKFAKFIKEKREALGKSIPDLSEEVFGNRRNNYIGDIERGKRKGVTLETMSKILEALNSIIVYEE